MRQPVMWCCQLPFTCASMDRTCSFTSTPNMPAAPAEPALHLCISALPQEADLAIVADMGTLQRLPAIVGHGVAAELALTARDFSGGLVGWRAVGGVTGGRRGGGRLVEWLAIACWELCVATH